MDALASPAVGIVHDGSVIHFTKHPEGSDRAGYRHAPLVTPLAAQADRPHECVFASGLKWQLVPERLYRYEDRRAYLSCSYPNVSGEIGVVAVPSCGALGVFERATGVPAGTDANHHVCELVVESAREIGETERDFAVAFFGADAVWIVIYRDGGLYHAQGRPSAGAADAVFHLAALFQQFGLDRATTPLFAGGAITADSMLRRDLAIYFAVVTLAEGLVSREPPPPAQLLLAYGRALRSGLHQPRDAQSGERPN